MLTGVEVVEVGVARQSGDKRETVTRHGLHDGFLRVIPVGNDSSQIKLLNSPEIEQHVIQLIGGLFQTTWSLRPGQGLTDIDRQGLPVLDINY
ncbi:hypothetical protein DRO_1741 [Deinococcus radiodurans R1 = ATCC 13939 = DSM 20539]|nr:hypothetical protein DRO_1741 [Deinococcus radiodurans R1 = ATCC 13939 = DSM 20539]